MFGRQARLPVDIILGLPHLGYDVDTHESAAEAQANLQLAFEIARRNLAGRSDTRCRVNQTLRTHPVFEPDEQVLLYRTYNSMDRLNPKLLTHGVGPTRSWHNHHLSSTVSDPPLVTAVTSQSTSLTSSPTANKRKTAGP